MSKHALKSPREAERHLAMMFKKDKPCRLLVREDKAFADEQWISLGEVSLFPEDAEDDSSVIDAVRRGAFEWQVRPAIDVEGDLVNVLQLDKAKSEQKLRRIVDSIAAIAARAGLIYPKFDPSALELMPFKRSTTIVADTSGALQGGLDFVVRYLHPAARIKVPAIVQMEIVNFADRFLSCRRENKIRRADLLIDHLRSQGAQRVLLRLELNTDTEIERTFLLGDPLRSAFQKDSDPELSQLNLSVEIKGYADRLILEAARQHQAQSSFGHKVQLLTSDQGLARMAIGEGITPLYFASVVSSDFLGKKVTGSTISPFTGTVRGSSLTSVVWEFATAFGCAKLQGENADETFEISAFGEGLSWSPYHSHDDLLWCRTAGVAGSPATSEPGGETKENSKSLKARLKDLSDDKAVEEEVEEITTEVSGKKPTLFRPNIDKLFSVIVALDDKQKLTEEEVSSLVSAKNLGGLDEYRRILQSGELIEVEGATWKALNGIKNIAIALRAADPNSLKASLRAIPSYRALETKLASLPTGTALDPSEIKRGLTAYTVLAESTLIGVMIYQKGLFPTQNLPTAEQFAGIALARFKELDQGDGLIATGAWLELMVEKDGVHPENARRLLSDANSKGLLRRSTEGSTIETRFDKHVFHVLRQKAGKPIIQQVHFYRGDYLIPEKSSVSVRIEASKS